jgi:DNA processing protein
MLQLPDERNGLLFVFRVFERVSYALILNTQDPVKPGTASASPDGIGCGCLPAHSPASAAVPDDRLDWLLLTQTPGLGREAQRRLLAAFGAPSAVLRADPPAWAEVVGPPRRRPSAPGRMTPRWPSAPCAGWKRRPGSDTCCHWGIPITPGSCSTPPILPCCCMRRAVALAAGAQRGRGRQPPCIGPGAGPGARLSPGPSARPASRWSRAGPGHRRRRAPGGAGGGGGTVAVVGTGLDRVYPARHRALAHRIQDQGLLLSEFPWARRPGRSTSPAATASSPA